MDTQVNKSVLNPFVFSHGEDSRNQVSSIFLQRSTCYSSDVDVSRYVQSLNFDNDLVAEEQPLIPSQNFTCYKNGLKRRNAASTYVQIEFQYQIQSSEEDILMSVEKLPQSFDSVRSFLETKKNQKQKCSCKKGYSKYY